MKKLISGMFSSVPDAQLLLATTGYDEDAPENAPEINSSIVSRTKANEASYHETNDLDDSLS